jgi:signal transduction histidine kinase
MSGWTFHRPTAEPDWTPPGEQMVFRVAQECLRNAARHAAAQTVDLWLSIENGTVVLEIADDGVGFDLATALRSTSSAHLGLRLLPDLASQAGATLQLATAPGAGHTMATGGPEQHDWRRRQGDEGSGRR